MASWRSSAGSGRPSPRPLGSGRSVASASRPRSGLQSSSRSGSLRAGARFCRSCSCSEWSPVARCRCGFDSRRSPFDGIPTPNLVGVKRPRQCDEEGGAYAAVNPAGVSPDDSLSRFSLQGIQDMVGDSLAAWEKNDVEEALRRDAAHCARRRLTPKDPDAAAVCAPVVVAARGSELVSDDDAHAGHQKGRDGAPPGALHGAGGQSALSARPVGGQCPPASGPLTRMAADSSWTTGFGEQYARGLSTFISGGPVVGKTCFLRCFARFLRSRMRADGAVVVVAPRDSAAKTAEDVTYRSFFGFVKDYKMSCDRPAQEARRLLALDRWKSIARRLAKVEVLLVDEISMVPADDLDVMCEMLRQCRASNFSPVVSTLLGTSCSCALCSTRWPSWASAGRQCSVTVSSS